MERIAEHKFARHVFDEMPQRKGKGVAIVWFRNDLRILDKEVLFNAWVSSEALLPVYCVIRGSFALLITLVSLKLESFRPPPPRCLNRSSSKWARFRRRLRHRCISSPSKILHWAATGFI